MSRYLILVAMVAASFFSCGGGGDTVSEPDTFVSDSTLGDQNPDNTTSDATPEVVLPDNTPPDTEAEIEIDPCDDEQFSYLMKFKDKELKCGGNICTLEIFKDYDGMCAAKCQPAFYENADKLQKVDDDHFQYTKSIGTFTCTFNN